MMTSTMTSTSHPPPIHALQWIDAHIPLPPGVTTMQEATAWAPLARSRDVFLMRLSVPAGLSQKLAAPQAKHRWEQVMRSWPLAMVVRLHGGWRSVICAPLPMVFRETFATRADAMQCAMHPRQLLDLARADALLRGVSSGDVDRAAIDATLEGFSHGEWVNEAKCTHREVGGVRFTVGRAGGGYMWHWEAEAFGPVFTDEDAAMEAFDELLPQPPPPEVEDAAHRLHLRAERLRELQAEATPWSLRLLHRGQAALARCQEVETLLEWYGGHDVEASRARIVAALLTPGAHVTLYRIPTPSMWTGSSHNFGFTPLCM